MSKSVAQCLKDISYKLGLIADYIVETGTTNNWYWQKYKSGRITMTKTMSIKSAVNVQYTTNNYVGPILSVALPFTIKSLRNFDAQHYGQYSAVLDVRYKSFDTKNVYFRFWNAVSLTSASMFVMLEVEAVLA